MQQLVTTPHHLPWNKTQTSGRTPILRANLPHLFFLGIHLPVPPLVGTLVVYKWFVGMLLVIPLAACHLTSLQGKFLRQSYDIQHCIGKCTLAHALLAGKTKNVMSRIWQLTSVSLKQFCSTGVVADMTISDDNVMTHFLTPWVLWIFMHQLTIV